jgi:hypothetical protein
MNVEPEALGVAGTIVVGLVGAIAKLYADLGKSRDRIAQIEEERRVEAKAARVDAIADTKQLIDGLTKVSALAEAVGGAGQRQTRRSMP